MKAPYNAMTILSVTFMISVKYVIKRLHRASFVILIFRLPRHGEIQTKLEMWANAQSDGRPAEYRWRPLFSAAVWLTPTIRVPCSNAAKTRNPLKLPGVPQTNEMISATGGPKFTILWGM